MNNLAGHRGVALVYILVIISAFSLYMLREASASRVKNNRLALEFTIAQTNAILNAAYAYRLKNNDWPIDNSDNCLLPNEFIDGPDEVFNGWGFEIVGHDDCEDDEDYEIIQTVPEQYAQHLVNTIGKAQDIGQNGGPNGTRKIRFALGVQGGSDNFFELGELGSWYLDPYTFETLDCDSGRSVYVYGLDGFCGGRKEFLFGVSTGPSYYSGFETNIKNVDQFFYSMFITEVHSNGQNADTYSIDSTSYASHDFGVDDGNSHANHRCPINGEDINTLVLSWCEN